MTVHAQAPLAPPRADRDSSAGQGPVINVVDTRPRGLHAATPPSAVESPAIPAARSQKMELPPTPRAIAEPAARLVTDAITGIAPHPHREQVPRAGTAKIPEPLLEETAAAAVQPAIAPVAQSVHSPLRQQIAHAEPTEVHVHIGRIEVIAATEPVPKKGRTTSRNTLPLSDYLARRTRP